MSIHDFLHDTFSIYFQLLLLLRTQQKIKKIYFIYDCYKNRLIYKIKEKKSKIKERKIKFESTTFRALIETL
jgi:hypothetical protein